ncbi:DPP IV N-terminal domain-containing protein [Fulvivirga maritima]|uniref:DPP IV N-terminal domain-containing protein n=1 Tax=Fulvivirga maritima TaxID=2904247 RepID=UPI001F32AF99|nr:DPP IV N-terminal domain-containing protein [Fulvivirga maritima]UII26178.1 DPP IV N-terminal domain-containing protein [Fulvivirga maritima]
MKRAFLFCLLLCFLMGGLQAQPTREDYKHADEVAGYGKLAYGTRIEPEWLNGSLFWYKINRKEGNEYVVYDMEQESSSTPLNQEDLAAQLNDSLSKDFKPFKLPLRNEKFSDDLTSFSFHLDGFKWTYGLKNKSLSKEKLPERPDWGYWAEARDELGNDPVTSPDGKWVAFIKNYNVVVKDKASGKETVLSFDGAEGNLYSSYLAWSPDSKKLATYQVRPNVKKYFYLIESSPNDQLQPKLHKREYLKPGDAVPIKQPALFDIETLKQIAVDGQPFENQFDLSHIQWMEDSKGFIFDFNERGHQKYQVVRVNAATGKTKVLIEETSNTYVEYPQLRKWMYNDDKQIIWKSQRDGWFHLYLYDAVSGEQQKQITKGEWLVRNVVDIDQETGQIWFEASGLKKGRRSISDSSLHSKY